MEDTNLKNELQVIDHTKELEAVILEHNIEPDQALSLRNSFQNFIKLTTELEAKAKAIVVTDISQKKEMAEAREIRLELKKIRTDSENKRKEMKESSLRTGSAIDAVAKIVKNIVIPLEDHLEEQEKFAEIQEKLAREKRDHDRYVEITQYTQTPEMYTYKEMTDEVFASLIANLKEAHDRKSKEEEEARLAQIKKEQDAKDEAERNRIELERMKREEEVRKETEAKENAARIEQERQAEETRRAEIQKQEEAHQAELAKAEELRKVEETEKNRIAEELRLKNEAEENAKREAEEKEKAEREAKAELDRQASLAPEKDKLFAYAEKLKTIDSPKDLSKAGLEIVNNAEAKLLALSQEIKEAIKNL